MKPDLNSFSDYLLIRLGFLRALFFKYGIVLIFLALSTAPLNAQSGFVQNDHSVYEFLERMHLKLEMDYSELIKPKTRREVILYLSEIANRRTELSDSEWDETKWYLREFYYDAVENKNKSYKDTSIASLTPRWHLYEYADSNSYFNVDPILGGSLVSVHGERQKRTWSGFRFFISMFEKFGLDCDFRDNSESGKFVDKKRIYTSGKGIQIIGGQKDEIQYSEVNGSISFINNYLTLALGKGAFQWGSGYNSRIILSAKSPSYPYFRFDLSLTSWIKLYYIFATLNSRVMNEADTYLTGVNDKDSTYSKRLIERNKYYAAHIIEVKPAKGIIVALGESVVFSDQVKLGFLIPPLFFRATDHYFEGGKTGKSSNGQFFLDVSVNKVRNTKFYGTLFIDEMSLGQIFKGDYNRNQTGYTIGVTNYASMLPNVTVRAEYTKVLPWVYSNFIPAQTYTNSGYALGHYIGQNSDNIYCRLDYRIMPRLNASAEFEQTRNGGFADIVNQYEQPAEKFLYGPVRKQTDITFTLSYEYMHDLTVKSSLKLEKISDADLTRTLKWQTGQNNSLIFAIYYGL